MKTLAVLVLGSVMAIGCGDGSKDLATPGEVTNSGRAPQKTTDSSTGSPPLQKDTAKPLSVASKSFLPTSLYLASAIDLPVCDGDRKAMLAYLVAEKEFWACDGIAWTKVQVPVEQLAQNAGPQMVVPTPAPEVVDRKVRNTYCIKSPYSGLNFEYEYTEYLSGKIDTKCGLYVNALKFFGQESHVARTAMAGTRFCQVRYSSLSNAPGSATTSFDYDYTNIDGLSTVKLHQPSPSNYGEQQFSDSDCRTTEFK